MSNKRVHDLDKIRGGDVGAVDFGDVFGPCPSCGADLHIGHVEDPRTGRIERAIMHAVPFCTYYLKTDPIEIERAVKQKES